MWKDHIYLKTNTSDELELYSSLDTPSSEESSDSEDSSFFLEFFLDFLDEWLLDSESTSILLFFLLCFGGDFDGEGSGVAFWKVKKYGEEYTFFLEDLVLDDLLYSWWIFKESSASTVSTNLQRIFTSNLDLLSPKKLNKIKQNVLPS